MKVGDGFEEQIVIDLVVKIPMKIIILANQ
jgi:hypothetical protein